MDKETMTILNKYKLEDNTYTITSMKVAEKEKGNFFIFVGLFHVDLIILKYDTIKNEFNFHSKIDKACSNLKPGISSIDYIESNLLGKNILLTGAYDYRFRLYEIKADSLINFLGSKKVDSDGIIHQIKIFEDSESENIYLFVCTEGKLFHIYNLI